MPTDPINHLESQLARIRAELYEIDFNDVAAQARLSEMIFTLKSRLDPLKRAAALLSNPTEPACIFPIATAPTPTPKRQRKRPTRNSSEARRILNSEIEALSAALAGITDSIPPHCDQTAWITGYRFGLMLRALPDPQ